MASNAVISGGKNPKMEIRKINKDTIGVNFVIPLDMGDRMSSYSREKTFEAAQTAESFAAQVVEYAEKQFHYSKENSHDEIHSEAMKLFRMV